MSDEEKKNQGWRFSKKNGLYGPLSDPTKLHENKLVKEYLESIVKDEERKANAYAFMVLKRLLYLVHQEMRPLLDNSQPELLKICNEMSTIIADAIGTNKDCYKYSPIPSRNDFF